MTREITYYISNKIVSCKIRCIIFLCFLILNTLRCYNNSNSLLVLAQSQSEGDQSYFCNSWLWNNKNPSLYWLNINQTIQKRQDFYNYMQLVNYKSKRLKGLNHSHFNKHVGVSLNYSNNLLRQVEMVSNYLYAIWIAHSNFYDGIRLRSLESPYALLISDDIKFLYQPNFTTIINSTSSFHLLKLTISSRSQSKNKNDDNLSNNNKSMSNSINTMTTDILDTLYNNAYLIDVTKFNDLLSNIFNIKDKKSDDPMLRNHHNHINSIDKIVKYCYQKIRETEVTYNENFNNNYSPNELLFFKVLGLTSSEFEIIKYPVLQKDNKEQMIYYKIFKELLNTSKIDIPYKINSDNTNCSTSN